MPFGLCNTGATFQRVIKKIIKGVENSTAYIENLLTFSLNFEQHLNDLRILFPRIERLQSESKIVKMQNSVQQINVSWIQGVRRGSQEQQV